MSCSRKAKWKMGKWTARWKSRGTEIKWRKEGSEILRKNQHGICLKVEFLRVFFFIRYSYCHEHYMRVVMNVVNIVKNVMTDEKGHLIFLVLK